jgi:putative transposase
MGAKFSISERRACRVADVHRSTKRYKSKPKDDSKVLAKIHEIIASKPRYGMPMVHLTLRRGGMKINHKKTARIYREAGLQIKMRPPKRKRRRPISELPRPTATMQKWSMDFVHDNLASGRAIRTLNILDEFNQESVKIEVDTSLPSLRVVHVLNRLKATIGLPKEIGVDSGPEFTSDLFQQWAKDNGVKLGYCQPGNKNQNAFIESFNARFRDECLNMHWFKNLDEARDIIEGWRVEYNTERPQNALGGMTPLEYGRDHVYKIAG